MEQAADLGGQCLSTKATCKSTTLKNEPSNTIKNKVTDFLKEHGHIMKLKYDNEKRLVECCGCVSEIWTRSAVFTSERREFLANRMVDDVLKMCPVWDNIISTMP